MYNHSQRPRDSEPDDRNLNPNQYEYYIQEHGKECDRLENELNQSYLRKKDNTIETSFQKNTKYILENQDNNFNNNNMMKRNNSYNPTPNYNQQIYYNNYNQISNDKNNRNLNNNQKQNLSQRNYIKSEPHKIQNENYDDIYYDRSQNTNFNYNINKSMEMNKSYNNNNNYQNPNKTPYYTEFGMKIYPGNYQGNTFNRPIRNNYYDKIYPKNIRYNLNDIKQDFHTKSAVSQTIPDYILYDDKGNKLRPYYFYDNNNITYNQYNSYKNDYGNSRFGDPTYNYYLNGPMRSDVSKDWRFPPQYYYDVRGQNNNLNIKNKK